MDDVGVNIIRASIHTSRIQDLQRDFAIQEFLAIMNRAFMQDGYPLVQIVPHKLER